MLSTLSGRGELYESAAEVINRPFSIGEHMLTWKSSGENNQMTDS